MPDQALPRRLNGKRRACGGRFTPGIPYSLRVISQSQMYLGSNPAFV